MENMMVKSKVEPMLIALGQYTKERRLSLGMSQQELATSAGLHRTYVSEVERGNRNLSIGAAALLAHGLGMQFRELLLAIDLDGLQKTEQCESSFEPELITFPETMSTLTGSFSEQSNEEAYEKQPA